MSWKNWGDHPVVVGIGVVAGIAGLIGLALATVNEDGGITNTGSGNQILGDGNTINQGQRDIVNIPCVDGGGSGGWMFEADTPEEYYPINILKVQQWAIRNYPDHPMYDPDDKFSKYGTCAIIPTENPG